MNDRNIWMEHLLQSLFDLTIAVLTFVCAIVISPTKPPPTPIRLASLRHEFMRSPAAYLVRAKHAQTTYET